MAEDKLKRYASAAESFAELTMGPHPGRDGDPEALDARAERVGLLMHFQQWLEARHPAPPSWPPMRPPEEAPTNRVLLVQLAAPLDGRRATASKHPEWGARPWGVDGMRECKRLGDDDISGWWPLPPLPPREDAP